MGCFCRNSSNLYRFGANFPKKKWYILGVFSVLAIFYELILFIDTINSFNFIYPNNLGEDLIDDSLKIGSPFFFLFLSFVSGALLFDGFGCLIKGLKSEGIVRKKLFILSSGFIIFLSIGIFDQINLPGIVLFFVRISTIVSFWLWYIGLREVSSKVKSKPKKEVKVEEGLFRVSQRPDNITEEEISISKEKKICLVCKGKVIGLTYICTECEAFYCVNCAQAISNLENQCWACNTPIDSSKPVKEIKTDNEVKIDLKTDFKKKK